MLFSAFQLIIKSCVHLQPLSEHSHIVNIVNEHSYLREVLGKQTEENKSCGEMK